MFLDKLKKFDKDSISDKVIAKVKVLTDNPDFTPEKILKQSVAASGLCKWCHAMVLYNRVAKVVEPKKAALKVAIGALEAAQANLAVKQGELQAVRFSLYYWSLSMRVCRCGVLHDFVLVDVVVYFEFCFAFCGSWCFGVLHKFWCLSQ